MRKRKLCFNKKSMHWKTDSLTGLNPKLALPLLLSSLILSGCAGKPWTDPLEPPQAEAIEQLVDKLYIRDQSCGKSLAADLSVYFHGPLENSAVSGYFQFSAPSFYKFVMTNPLGQPVLLIAGDQKSYQAINSLARKYMAGSVRSFGIRNKIPQDFLKSNWQDWLMGRNHYSSEKTSHIRNDKEGRGTWISFNTEDGKYSATSHLLLDSDQKLYRTRILENSDGKTIAEIRYDNWIGQGGCLQPQDINITGLDYGTNIQLKLSDVVLSTDVDPKTYRLPIPSGYLKQYLP